MSDDRELDEAFVMAVLHNFIPAVTWRVVVLDGVRCVFVPLDDLAEVISEQVRQARERQTEAGLRERNPGLG